MIAKVDGYKVRVPRTCRDVLEWSVEICARVLSSEEGIDSCAIINAAQGIGRHTIEHSADDLLGSLGADELFDLGNAIVETAELPAEALRDARKMWDLATRAGDYDLSLADDLPCECLACKGIEATDERCLYAGISQSGQTLAALRIIAEDPALLAAPWWVYQLRRHNEASRALGTAAIRQRKKREDRDVRNARDIVNQVWPAGV